VDVLDQRLIRNFNGGQDRRWSGLPMIHRREMRHSDDVETFEIVMPAEFATEQLPAVGD
jgi:hypothetical protein